MHLLRGISTSSVASEDEQITRFAEEGLKDKHMRVPDKIWFEGAEGKRVQGWVHLPPGWKKEDTKKWPAILQIHGGPQSIWDDSWSTRWNAVGTLCTQREEEFGTRLSFYFTVWANQGYVVAQLNITGSLSFGQEFVDAINQDWGGKPFVDLRKGWKYVLENYPQVN